MRKRYIERQLKYNNYINLILESLIQVLCIFNSPLNFIFMENY